MQVPVVADALRCAGHLTFPTLIRLHVCHVAHVDLAENNEVAEGKIGLKCERRPLLVLSAAPARLAPAQDTRLLFTVEVQQCLDDHCALSVDLNRRALYLRFARLGPG